MVHRIHPLQDPRWAEFVDGHRHSSAFHTVAWLKALQRTYGYEPIALTTSPPGAVLENGLVLSSVSSWITGRRLVSLPFSDHCEPLAKDATDEAVFAAELRETLRRDKLRYVELRPKQLRAGPPESSRPTHSYCFHEVDLRPDLSMLFANLHKSSTQRKIRRAEREGLIYKSGRSEELLGAFWDLFLMTRRRRLVPPQPRMWFRNLIDCFGEALQIRVAFKTRQPVAAILTLRHKDTLVYKYGCSDERFHSLGGTQLLFWRSIEEAKRDGLIAFDLGRTDWDNQGLITFKDRWGAARSTLTYFRLSDASPSAAAARTGSGWAGRIAKHVVPHLPDRVLAMVGSALYRHIA